MEFNNDEKRFLNSIENMAKKIMYNYVVIGVFFAVSLLGLVIGISEKSKDGFLMFLFFSFMAAFLFVYSMTVSKISKIIDKLNKPR